MTATLLALAGIVVAPVLGYFAAYRKLSGRIGTSEASKLWDEATAMRAEYREQAERMQEVTARMQKIIDRLRERIAALEDENLELRRQLGALT